MTTVCVAGATGGTPEPNVAGTLPAVRAASRQIGLVRGLDTLLPSGARP